MDFRYLFNMLMFAAVLLSSSALQAQDFNLDTAVLYALEHNPELNAVQHQLQASSAQTSVSKAGQMPTLTISHTARLSDNPLDAFADRLNTRQVAAADFAPGLLNDPDSSELYFTQLALRWSLYNGGRVSAMIENAEQTEKHVRLQYQREREKIAYAVTTAYLNVLAAKQSRQISEDAVEAASQHARTTSRLASEGRIVESDKLAAAVNLAAIRSQREQAETRLQSAIDQFKVVLGLPMDSEINLMPTKMKTVSAESAVKSYEDKAIDRRKDLAAARAMVQAAKAGVDAERSVRRPKIDLVASSNWYDDNPGFDSQSSSIMGVISFDLYDGTSSGKIDIKRSKQREMQWQLQALEQAVRKQVRDAYNSLHESGERLAIAENNVELAKQAVKLVKQRYGQGRTILLDLLQSERLYSEARMEKLTAQLNLDVARVALPLATGNLSLPAGVSP
ncbi:MAG: TolC family protein [Gammaproteobacteria bacterium]|nr:TolC family protein [Gammaproteobacteria bacterium]MCW8922930.1 TolC family protein [Gammaproteobacteria bacterium]